MKPTPKPVVTCLSSKEQKDPLLAITDLFEQITIDNLQIDLRLYLKTATTEPGWWIYGQPWEVHELQQRLEKLMEACWLLLQQHEEVLGEVQLPGVATCWKQWKDDTDDLRQEYQAIRLMYGGRVRLLRDSELDEPVTVLKQLFHVLSLPDWKIVLTKWTEYALCGSSILREGDIHLFLHYEQLEKLLEVAWVIHYDPDEAAAPEREATRSIAGEKSPTPDLLEEFSSFLQEVPPERLTRNLLRIYVDYLQYHGHNLPGDYETIRTDFLKLYNLFRSAELDAKGLYRELKKPEQVQAKTERT
ncbi:hypothetical protein [Pontibacter sp. SGAir0037]|uniref:hypothetical protein n=1 Tax=Pontibacter sp. SGAir0037 TaxID=2571030 RepID=UPI0010F7B6A8|nr:hypothetical protein [Pontibacter sp. SGAir0037]